MLTLSVEEDFHWWISITVIVVSLPVFLLEIPISKSMSTWRFLGPSLPARLSWFLFEIPNLIWSAICVIKVDHQLPPTNKLLLSLFVLHYIQRTIFFPLRMSPTAKGMPLAVVLAALVYTIANGYLQARGICQFQTYEKDHLWRPASVLGLIFFLYGAYVNLKGDALLRSLRAQNKGYQIPRSGWFEYVSAAHYFGEILEWTGFALISWSLAAFSFAFFTAANLIPRGIAQHQWYKEKFRDYPTERKAIIPFIL